MVVTIGTDLSVIGAGGVSHNHPPLWYKLDHYLLTGEDGVAVTECAKLDLQRTINRIVDVSEHMSKRLIKAVKTHALHALAMVASASVEAPTKTLDKHLDVIPTGADMSGLEMPCLCPSCQKEVNDAVIRWYARRKDEDARWREMKQWRADTERMENEGGVAPVAEAPAEAPVAEAPAEAPVAEAPAEAPVAESPAEAPVAPVIAEAPAEAPVAEAPVAPEPPPPAEAPIVTKQKPLKGKKKRRAERLAQKALIAAQAKTVIEPEVIAPPMVVIPLLVQLPLALPAPVVVHPVTDPVTAIIVPKTEIILPQPILALSSGVDKILDLVIGGKFRPDQELEDALRRIPADTVFQKLGEPLEAFLDRLQDRPARSRLHLGLDSLSDNILNFGAHCKVPTLCESRNGKRAAVYSASELRRQFVLPRKVAA